MRSRVILLLAAASVLGCVDVGCGDIEDQNQTSTDSNSDTDSLSEDETEVPHGRDTGAGDTVDTTSSDSEFESMTNLDTGSMHSSDTGIPDTSSARMPPGPLMEDARLSTLDPLHGTKYLD